MKLLKKVKLHHLFFALLFIYPIIVHDQTYYLYSGGLIFIYIIMTLALNILTGYGGQISIGQSAFMAIGAYTSTICTLKLGIPFLIAVPLSGFLTALIGFIIGLPAVKLSGHLLAVATLGFGLAVPELILKWDDVTGGFTGLFPDKPVVFGFAFDSDFKIYFLLLIMTLIVTWMINNLIKGRIGRAFVAIRESEISAAAAGINVPLYKVLMFSISGFYTGIAGSLYAHFVGFISPFDFNLNVSLILLAMVVIGGVASIPGSYLGAILLAMIPPLTSGLPGFMLILTGVPLVLIILFLPNGLISLGKKWGARQSAANATKRGETA